MIRMAQTLAGACRLPWAELDVGDLTWALSMLAVWLRAAASARGLARCCPTAGALGRALPALGVCSEPATSFGSSAHPVAGDKPWDAPVGGLLMPTVVQEPLSGEQPNMTSPSDESERASA